MEIVVVYIYAEPGIGPDVIGPFDTEDAAETWAIETQKMHPGVFYITNIDEPF